MGNMLRQIVAPLPGPGDAKDPFLTVHSPVSSACCISQHTCASFRPAASLDMSLVCPKAAVATLPILPLLPHGVTLHKLVARHGLHSAGCAVLCCTPMHRSPLSYACLLAASRELGSAPKHVALQHTSPCMMLRNTLRSLPISVRALLPAGLDPLLRLCPVPPRLSLPDCSCPILPQP